MNYASLTMAVWEIVYGLTALSSSVVAMIIMLAPDGWLSIIPRCRFSWRSAKGDEAYRVYSEIRGKRKL
jgi:hypothetical protein